MFRKGDIITGTKENGYGITNSTVNMEVKEVNNSTYYSCGYSIDVQIIEGYSDTVFPNLNPDMFKLIRSNKPKIRRLTSAEKIKFFLTNLF
jgi:hypothetical protein